MKDQGPSSLPCWLKIFLRPKTSLRLRMHVPQPSDVSQDFEVIIPCRTSAADPRPYPRLVHPAVVTLPLHSTPMDEVPDVRGSLGTQFVYASTRLIGKSPHTAGQTHHTLHQADSGSLHYGKVPHLVEETHPMRSLEVYNTLRLRVQSILHN